MTYSSLCYSLFSDLWCLCDISILATVFFFYQSLPSLSLTFVIPFLFATMASDKELLAENDEDLVEYEDEEVTLTDNAAAKSAEKDIKK